MHCLDKMLAAKILLCCFLSAPVIHATLPDYITLCKKNDPQLNSCFEKEFEKIVEKLGPGLPEIGLRQIDPYNYGNTKFKLGPEFELTLMDMAIYGISNAKQTKAKFDVKTGNFEVSNSIPMCYSTAKYRGKGKLLMFEIDSSGTLTNNFTKVDSVIKGIGKITQKDGKDYVQYDDVTAEVKIKKTYAHFSNFFPNEELNKNVNDALNANIDLFYDTFIPVVNKGLKDAMFDAFNHFFSRYSLQELFPE